MKTYDLNNKVILITGAASGLGRCLALNLADKAKKLILVDKNEEMTNELFKILKDKGIDVDQYIFDFKYIDLLEERVDKIYKNYEQIDVLFNCAGMEIAAFIDDFTLGLMQEVIDVNLLAPFIFSNKIIPMMKRNKSGQIVNIVSDMAKRSIPGRAAYCMSKFALLALSESMRLELEPYNIDAVTVYPGVMNTNFWKNVIYHGRIDPKGFVDKRKRSDPDEVAKRIIKKLEKRELIISKFSRVKIYLLINYIFPKIGDYVTKKYTNFKKANL